MRKREWLLLCLLGGVVATLILATLSSRPKRLPPERGEPLPLSTHIQVSVAGPALQRGPLTVARGTKIGDLLPEISPLPQADLKRLPLARELQEGQRIEFRLTQKIKIYASGAGVREGWVVLDEGATGADFLAKVALSEGALTTKIRRRKRLKDGERIEIPLRKGRAQGKNVAQYAPLRGSSPFSIV